MYYHKYKKYKEKYLNLKHGGSNTYLYQMENLIPVPKFTLNLFEKYLGRLNDKTAIEFGVGNGLKSIPISRLFKTYVGVEPDNNLYQLALSNCKKFDCTINFVNRSIEKIDIDKKFDAIIFINVFQFVDYEKAMSMIDNLLTDNGIVYIQQSKPVPMGWGSPFLNKDSPKFDNEKWKMMENRLNKTKDFILSLNNRYNVEYYDEIGWLDIFIVKNYAT